MQQTITGQHDEIVNQVQAIVAERGGHVPSIITYESGGQRKVRLAISSLGYLMRLAKGRRRWGHSITGFDRERITAITLTLPDQTTPAQAYVKDLRRLRNYFFRNADPRLWANIRAQLEAMTEEQLEALERADCESHYDAWKLAGELGLPKWERFKTLTLKSCKAPAYVIEGVRQAIGVSEFSYAWRGNYDYSVEGRLCEDGIYRAWLSAEYKGCGNGHYYLLISAERAIFAEDD